jgi:hypothetical protein
VWLVCKIIDGFPTDWAVAELTINDSDPFNLRFDGKGSLSLTAAITLTEPSPVTLQCHAFGSTTHLAGAMTAVSVGTLVR